MIAGSFYFRKTNLKKNRPLIFGDDNIKNHRNSLFFPLDAFKWSLRQFSSVSRVSVCVWHESVQLFCSYIWWMFFFLTNYWVSPRHVTFISVSRCFFPGGVLWPFFQAKAFFFFYTVRGLICDINSLFRELSPLFMAKAFGVICCPVRENKRLRLKLLFLLIFRRNDDKKMARKRQNVSGQKVLLPLG